MIKILFFGQLRERLNCAETEVEIPSALTVKELKEQLAEQHPAWQKWLCDTGVFAAVNQTMSSPEAMVQDDREVAFFPPVTGG